MVDIIYLILIVFLAVTFLPYVWTYVDLIAYVLPAQIITVITLAIVVSALIWILGRDH